MNKQAPLRIGLQLADSQGRVLTIKDLFVPKNKPEKAYSLPSSYRYHGRQVVVFDQGILMRKEVERRIQCNWFTPVSKYQSISA